MSWFERFCFAVLVWVIAFVVVTDARGDEGLERRLVALRLLTTSSGAGPGAGRAIRGGPRGQARSAQQCLLSSLESKVSDPRFDLSVTVAVQDASVRFALDPRLIRSVIRHESAYDNRALSPAGAMGLMQLMPETAQSLGVVCPFNPRENILAGARYLRAMFDRFGEWSLAVAAYNAGPTRVAEGRVPVETHRYVRRVMQTWGYPYNPSRKHP